MNGLRSNLLVRNTLWMTGGQAVRVGMQAVYFILIARVLKAEGYGAFAGAGAIACIVAPFASLGSGNILVKRAARDPSTLAAYWGNALVVTVGSSIVLGAVMCLAAPLVLPPTISPWLLLPVVAAEIFFSRLTDIAGQAFQAVERLHRTAQFHALQSSCRVVAVLLMIAVCQQPTVVMWGWFYLAGTVVSAAIPIWLVYRELGRPDLTERWSRSEAVEGFYFAVGLSAQNIYNDIDKTFLTRLASLSAAGTYGAAYRMVDIAFIPVRSLLFSSYAKFFQHGAMGVRAGARFAVRLVPVAVLYSLAAGAGLYLAGPAIPLFLGREYQDTVSALQWLAPLPLLKSLHYLAADTMTGGDYQGLRSAIQVAVALLNVLLCLWLIRDYSWRGAAWASLMSDGALAVCLWICVGLLSRKREIPS